METILLAADGSEAGERALAFAIDLAKDTAAVLEIISIQPLHNAGGGAATDAPAREAELLLAPERVAQAGVEKARIGGIDARAHAGYGDVVACVIRAALALHADVLIVGARGLGAASGATLGSVAQALVRRSPIPVTVVHQLPIAARV